MNSSRFTDLLLTSYLFLFLTPTSCFMLKLKHNKTSESCQSSESSGPILIKKEKITLKTKLNFSPLSIKKS